MIETKTRGPTDSAESSEIPSSIERRGKLPVERTAQEQTQPQAAPEASPPTDRDKPASTETAAPPAPRRRRPLAVVALLTVGGLVFGGWLLLFRESEEETQLELMGNIDVRQVNLSFKVDGRIETLAVDEGDTVKTGQVVATLDQRYFNDDLRLARARRDTAAANLAKLEHGSRPEEIAQARAQTADREATLAKANFDFRRGKPLLAARAISQEDFDQLQAAQKVAEAQVKSAKESQRLVEIGPRQEDIDAARAQLAEQSAAVIQSERRLADSALIAPSDGIILTRARERGAIVSAGETVFTLTLATPVWVRTYVNERDLGLIRPDMPALVFTDSAPNRPYAGRIGFISPTAEFTPKTVETRELRTDLVYRLRVIVDNPDGGLRQGMPVTVRLQLPQARPKTFWQRVRSALSFERRAG